MYDLIIRGGWIVDGTGGPPYRADVALFDDMIAAVGTIDDPACPQFVDASGCYVTPGFIDAHVHGDLMLLDDPIHRPALKQGVTTYILGQDGSAFAPASPATMDYMRRYTAGFNGNPEGISYNWSSVRDYLLRFNLSTSLNVAYLIPNGNIRLEVMGHDPRPATDDELRRMQDLVRHGMDAGAVGLSSGLDYLPSLHADARELAALCQVIAPFDGVYVTHMRGYGPYAPRGMSEVCEIAEKSGVAAHISHYNGRSEVLLPLIDLGRARGLDLTFDTYPYLKGSTILGMVALPSWVQEGGIDATLTRLNEGAVRDRLRSEWFAGSISFPLELMTLARVAAPDWQKFEGMAVTEAARDAGLDACDFVCDVLLASDLAVGIVNSRPGDRTEDDMRAILRHPAHMAGSDGIFRGSFPHPRGWGAFARYLGRHTRELGDYTWPEAIAHLSSHAARRSASPIAGSCDPGSPPTSPSSIPWRSSTNPPTPMVAARPRG